MESHAEFVAEQSAEGAGAGSDRLPEFGQRGVVCRRLVQHPGNGLQSIVLRLRQVQWLFVRFAEFVDEDAEEASARGAAVVRRGVVVAAGASQGEQGLAGQAGGQEHGGMGWHEPGEGWREKHDPHICVAVGAVVVREIGGRPADDLVTLPLCAVAFGRAERPTETHRIEAACLDAVA